ncbi:uncharacterized protein [Tenebrio molitor]|uniref:uncharacterized protein n=1 Tax=Tenebrio molitor TaxID=7067 RepID=UPI001C3A4CA5|nr:unnamed protein product [Tenebrio molitor]
MKTQLIALVALIGLQASEGARISKSKRGFDAVTLGHGYSDDLTLSPSGWKVNTGDYNLQVDLPPPRHLPPPQIAIIQSNSLDKPVMEGQEYIPPQSIGAAVLPRMPIPATPVNAAAANIPASRGAVFLGSGSLGVVDLGNGAYALGSGSIGYSGSRSRPRPTAKVPVFPPIQAAPNLIPAAVPSPAPAQPIPPIGLVPGSIDFNHPLLNVPQVPQVDQNGYEYLPPNRIGFGTPNPPRPIRTRQQFATPTALQLQPQGPQFTDNIQFTVPFGHSASGGFPVLA